jgi:cellulose synthase/poly-beta-1,6-N-acetylglucosamine synthase-like glycosyltransferase
MFPSTSGLEDLNIGFYFAASRVKIYSGREIEIGDSPDHARSGFWQQYRWAYGVFSVWKYRRAFGTNFAKDSRFLKMRAWVVAFGHLEGIGSWNAVTYIFAMATWQAAYGDIFASVYLTSYFLEFIICIFWFWGIKLLPIRCVLAAPCAVLADLLRRSFPANLALFDYCFGKQRNIMKTDHAKEVAHLA